MKRKLLLSVVALVSVFVVQAQTADEIIAKYFENTGGIAKWKALLGTKITAKLNNGGMELPIEIIKLKDGRQATSITFQGLELKQEVFDGATLWSTNFQTKTMFTGIIEAIGTLKNTKLEGTNITFTFNCPFTNELKIDQSLAHNGVCLTVIDVQGNDYSVTAIDETLQKTNIGKLQIGDNVNLERCMPAHGRFDGHIVQGHVDQTGVVTNIIEQNGSWLYDFIYSPDLENVTVEKGSVCINGTSLTVFNSGVNNFRVAIIPYTYENTIFHTLKVGDVVNLEFDIVGKYIKKMLKM